MIMKRSEVKTYRMTCGIRDGIPTIDGGGRGHYVSRGGVQMLVVQCRPGQRIRINDSIEVIVLTTDDEEVRLGIGAADSQMHAAG
ncbi:MAG TPA: hypothetical protein DD670_21455 [Planctomycetaceae bacterium]|nr:hypothetical protein [Planctomycetaceae bacterium]